MTFMTLEKFLLFTERDGRSIHRGERLDNNNSAAQDLVERYYIAKRSWEVLGDKGPDVGAVLIFPIVSDKDFAQGWGARWVVKKRLTEEKCPPYLSIFREKKGKDDWPYGSCIQLDYWWAQVRLP